jgi:D-glycero-D-manno-heptose 1,7-bisphosphate phosphatase
MDAIAVFLDRDGVINQDSPDYIKHRREFHLLPGSVEAIARMSRVGIRVIVVTNQSGINRGIVPPRELQAIHLELRSAVSMQGGRISDIFFCPHRPDENCDCRKPKPGMIQAAAERHGLDLSRSVMVGDSAKDILAGKAAGCGATVLVKTGNGESAVQSLAQRGALPDHVANDLAAAANWILDKRHA